MNHDDIQQTIDELRAEIGAGLSRRERETAQRQLALLEAEQRSLTARLDDELFGFDDEVPHR